MAKQTDHVRRETYGRRTRTIRRNRYDNWRGYESGKFVKEFGNGVEETAEQAAERWMREVNPHQEK